jgi:hypothetical protein
MVDRDVGAFTGVITVVAAVSWGVESDVSKKGGHNVYYEAYGKLVGFLTAGVSLL